jgi:hypothetical protein
LGLGHADARLADDQPHVEQHVETFAQCGHVAQIAAGNDHPLGDLPVELLHDLERDGLLSLDAQAVHRVREIDPVALGHLLHDLHAAIEVRVQSEDHGAVGHGLDQLGQRDLAPGQEDDGRDPRGRGVRCRARSSPAPC